jgi:hypothetical protein
MVWGDRAKRYGLSRVLLELLSGHDGGLELAFSFSLHVLLLGLP